MSKRLKEYSEEIQIPIYDENLVVVFSNDLGKSATKLGETVDSADVCGLFIYNEEAIDNSNCAILYKLDSNIDVRVHEVSHFCIHVLKTRGINPFDESGEEAFCYLIGFTINKIEEINKKAKKKFRIS